MTKFIVELDVWEEGITEEGNDDIAYTYLRNLLAEPIKEGDCRIIRVNNELDSLLSHKVDSEGRMPDFRKGDEIYIPCIKLKGVVIEQRLGYDSWESFWGNVIAEMEDGKRCESNSWQCIHKYIHNRLNDMARIPNTEYMKWLIKDSATAGEAMAAIMKDYRGSINPALVHPLIQEHFNG